MDQVVVKGLEIPLERDGFVYRPLREAGGRGKVGRVTAKEPQFGVGVIAPMLHPTVKEQISPLYEISVRCRIVVKQPANLLLKLEGQLLVSIERKYPGSGALFNGGVLLGGESLPRLEVHLGIEGARDLERSIGRTRVKYDYFIGKLNAGQCAGQIDLFVHCDDGNR